MESQREGVRETVPCPLFVHLDGARVACIGAGAVAERKVETLLAYGARVVVVAPEATERIGALAHAGEVEWVQRAFEPGDLNGARLAIAATASPSVNRAVAAEADARGVLVNVVDAPELCTCIVPSVMRRGQLQIAVSTNGAAPGVAREVRKGLERQFPDWWERYIDVLADVRALVKERVPGDARGRSALFEAIRAADLEGRIAAGERLDAQMVYDEVVAPRIAQGGAR